MFASQRCRLVKILTYSAPAQARGETGLAETRVGINELAVSLSVRLRAATGRATASKYCALNSAIDNFV
jgi:hypothetical protein